MLRVTGLKPTATEERNIVLPSSLFDNRPPSPGPDTLTGVSMLLKIHTFL